MTQIREGGVEIPAVTQADREAAADWARSNSRHAQAANMRRGSCDNAPLVQAFMRHRLAAYTPTPSPEIAEQPMGEDGKLIGPPPAEPMSEAERQREIARRVADLQREAAKLTKPADPTSVAGERVEIANVIRPIIMRGFRDRLCANDVTDAVVAALATNAPDAAKREDK